MPTLRRHASPVRRRRHRWSALAVSLLAVACYSLMQAFSFPAARSRGGHWQQLAETGRYVGQSSSGARARASVVRMNSLGVPKVAYRIPGAPNAEWIDIYNRLYRERIVFLGRDIDDQVANEIIGVLLYLDFEDSNKPIYLYINSAGGSVLAGLAIYDTLQHIKSPIVTINVGMAASMASFLLASGEKGKRMALPHSRIMMHQAMGRAEGQAEDIRVEAQQILTIQKNIVGMYANMTGKSVETIRRDLMRDNFMSAQEAKDYGLIDQVIRLDDVPDLARRAIEQQHQTDDDGDGSSSSPEQQQRPVAAAAALAAAHAAADDEAAQSAASRPAAADVDDSRRDELDEPETKEV